MRFKYVIGSGSMLDSAMAAWHEQLPSLDLRRIEIDPQAGSAELAAVLDTLDLTDADAFAALDARFLNFRRHELMDGLRQRGIPTPALVEQGAIVAADVKIGENSWIAAGAIIRHGSRIGNNVVVGAGAVIGSSVVIGNSVWIDQGVGVGRDARIGAHATLGMGVFVGHGVAIGDLCVLDKPGRMDTDLAAHTFMHASHANPLLIVGARTG